MHVAFFGLVLSTCAHSQQGPTPVVGPTVIPLTVHNLTRDEGKEKKFRADIAWSNEVFAPFKIAVSVWEFKNEPIGDNVLVEDGHDERVRSLIKKDGTLHVFLVNTTMLDGDDVAGFAYHSAGMRYFVLDDDASSATVAHEIGHTLGLDHTNADDNIMCSCRELANARFTDEQGDTMRPEARNLLVRLWKL